jgi:hypothetical protein
MSDRAYARGPIVPSSTSEYSFEQYFVELGGVLARPGPPDLGALADVAARYDLELDPSSIPRLAREHGLDLGDAPP